VVGYGCGHVVKLPAPNNYGAFIMEYNFLADFLAKFSYLTPWIQGIIIISAPIIPVSFFYFLYRITDRIFMLLAARNLCKKILEGKVEAVEI